MDKKTIEKRKEDLQKQLVQIQNQFNALTGAIQDCDYWLGQLKEEK